MQVTTLNNAIKMDLTEIC